MTARKIKEDELKEEEVPLETEAQVDAPTETPIEETPTEAPATEKVEASQPVSTEAPPAWAQKLMTSVDELQKENKMLKEIAGKGAVKSWENAQRDFTNKFAHFKVYNGKIVIGWSDLDYGKFNPHAKDALSENVFVTLNYLDGEKETINYVNFSRCKELMKVKILENKGTLTSIEFPPDIITKYELGKPDMMVATKFINA